MSLQKDHFGSYAIDLGGMCFREIAELGHLLVELGETGKVDGLDFDLENLTAIFDSTRPEVFLTDGELSTQYQEEEDE